ncbi:MAG: universal stress protein [Bacteroidota bacterium]
MNQILIPIDFTEESFQTLQYGTNLAKTLNCNLQLLHVIDLYEFGMNYTYPDQAPLPEISNELVEIRKKNAKESFEKLVSEMQKRKDGFPDLNYTIEVGLSTKKIIEKTENENVDYILLSGRKSNNSLNQLLNSSYFNIITQARVPVWIIPDNKKFEKIKKIVYATNYNDEDIPSLKKIARFAAPNQAEIIALHVTQNMNFQLKIKQEGFQIMVREKLKYDNISMVSIATSQGISRIHDFANEVRADIIVVMKENKSFLKKIFNKSATRQLTIETSIPLLVFHES